jgi:DNA-binding SARP family transcriptional activator
VAHGDSPEGDRWLAEAVEASALPRVVALWSHHERAIAAPLLARAMERDLGAGDAAACVAAACGSEVVEECAELLAAADPATRTRLAEAAAGAATVVGRLLQDPDAGVRRAARRTRARQEARPRPHLRFVTMGGFSVWRDGVVVPEQAFERQKARTLLAALLCARGPVHREGLVESLWPNLTPERGLAAMHSTLYALRRALEPGLSRREQSSVVVADGQAYRLVLAEADEWDAEHFLGLARAARAAAGSGSEIERLLEAEAAHGGPFLPEWPYAEWAAPTRTEVEETHRQVLERLADALAGRGQPAAAIARYRALLALEPEREGWHRKLMRVYADAGERALALRQYHACRALLRQRLGIEPSRETRALYAALLRDDGGATA